MLQSVDGSKLTGRYYQALSSRDLGSLAELYADDAEVIRYDGSAKGHDQIREFFDSWINRWGHFSLKTIDNMRLVDDLALWDATVDTQLGVLLTYDVVILRADGRIHRHVPSVRGFWGGP